MKKLVLMLTGLVFLLGLSIFVSAELLNEQIIREKMIWDLPELSGFNYGGMWEHIDEGYPNECIDLRYISPEDNDQHSEFYLCMFNSFDDSDSYFESRINDMTQREINGNKIFERTVEESVGTSRTYLWISGSNVITGWNGNDEGSILDDELFNVLAEAYLEKYPSTYGCSNGVCNSEPNEQGSNETNATVVYIEPDETTGPLKLNPPEDTEETGSDKSIILICNGCELENKCYPFGYRKGGDFCSDEELFINQLGADVSCENHFECKSNLCIEDKCLSQSFLQKIINWFKSLFG